MLTRRQFQERIQKYGLGGVKGGLSSPPLHSPPLPSPLFPLLPLEVGPLNPARGLGERCNWIWYILALKSDIWWQKF